MGFIFNIRDVLQLINCEVVKQHPYSLDINCPVCRGKNNEPDHSGHLNINLIKNNWRCNRCGIGGGMLDLYILFSGGELSRTEAKRRIEAREAIRGAAPAQLRLTAVLPEAPPTAASLEVRDLINREFLSRLKLAKAHRTKLKQRGLSDEAIFRAGYRSVPLFGAKKLVNSMVQAGFIPKHVPGFYQEEDGWRFLGLASGILIPVRGVNGLIHGFQVRFDQSNNKRYLTVSTGEKPGGASASGYIHIAGPIQKTMFVTEGALKADVAHELSDHSFVGLLGTSHWGNLQTALPELKSQGLEAVVEAFDMDQFENQHVKENAKQVHRIITNCGLKCCKMTWNSVDKGIDDHYYHQKIKEENENEIWEHFYVLHTSVFKPKQG